MEPREPTFLERNWKEYIKAILAGIISLSGYLVGILTGDQTLADVSFVQWLGAILFLGGTFGITYKAANRSHRNAG